MFGALKPRESRFFELFSEIGVLIMAAAQEFSVLIGDLNRAELHSQNIKDIEHKADEVTHRTIELLHKVFITPLDRDDIHQLIKKLDDVVDFIDAAAQRIFLYGVVKVTPADDRFALSNDALKMKLISYSARGLQNFSEKNPTLNNSLSLKRFMNSLRR